MPRCTVTMPWHYMALFGSLLTSLVYDRMIVFLNSQELNWQMGWISQEGLSVPATYFLRYITCCVAWSFKSVSPK